MIAEMVIIDHDQAREYRLRVNYRVRPEIGGAPGWIVDVDRVELEQAVIFFDKQWSEVRFEHDERVAAARFVERKYQREIGELCIEKYLAETMETA